MKRVLMRVVPWLLPACMVDTPVVEGEDDPLGKDLGAWCQSMCDRVGTCIDRSTDGCPGMCVEYYSGFSGKGHFCRDAGLRIMDCMEEATCEDLANSSGCDVSDEELSCVEPIGPTICQDPSTSGQPAQGFECSVGFDACSDGIEYSLECVGEGDLAECRCLVDGHTTGRFTPSRLVCPSGAEAIQICGWQIANGNEPLPAECGVIGADLPVSNPAECAVQYHDCDALDYEVRCVGSAGNAACECIVDGQTVGSFESSYGICPFLEGADVGRAAANYGCGFNLAW